MRLTELEAQFARYDTRIETWDVVLGPHETWHERGCPTEKKTGPREYRVYVDNLADAQCIFFVCPICFHKQGHQVEVTFSGRGVLDHQGTHNQAGAPTRWNVSGSGYADLTLTPSILLEGNPPCCQWHGFVTNGEAA